MSNPATELAELFASWTIPASQNAVYARQVESDTPWAFWVHQAHGVALVRAVQEELDVLARTTDVSDWLHYLPAWYKGAFAYNTSYDRGMTTTTEAIPSEAMRALRTLGIFWDRVGLSEVGSPTVRLRLRECLDDAIKLLETELTDWDQSEKEYLYSLLASARTMLEEYARNGESDIRSRVNEVIGVMTTIAFDLRASEGQDSTRFQRVMQWIGSTASVMRGTLYDAEALASLTGSVGKITGELSS